MIQAFLSSWPLFYHSYLAGWLIGFLLSLVGVLVVARDQIFIGAAMSQASTLGIALTMWASVVPSLRQFSFLGSDAFLSTMAVVFSIVAASLTAQGSRSERESHEAVTGWVFLISASLSILIVSHSPHGLEEVHRLLSSSIIGATTGDVWVFAILAVSTVFFLAALYRRILLFALDPTMAVAVGLKTRIWSVGSSLWLGLIIGLSIRSSGMLYTFGCLVLPALIAKNVCREVWSMFVAAPLFAVGTGILGFMLANQYDYPPGQMTVALFCFELASAWIYRRLRP